MAAPCAAPLGSRCAAPARLRHSASALRRAARSLGATTVNTSGPYRRPMGPGGGGGGGPPRPAGGNGPPRPAGGGGGGYSPRPGGSSTFTPRPGGAPFTPRPPSGPGGAPSRVGGRPFVRREQGPPPPPMNENIRVPTVRLVDEDKEMLGVVSREEALKKAEEAGLDLVMISPDADPPVCRLIDYSKYKYDQAIKAKEAQKKMAAGRQEIKELKMRYNIDTHDYEVRLRAAAKFLKDGDKVKLLCQFRGREMEFKQIAITMFEKFAGDLKDDGVIESKANIEGRSLVMILGPGAKVEGKAAAASAAKPAAQAAQAASRAAAAAAQAANPKPPPPPKAAEAAAADAAAPPAEAAPAVAAAPAE